MLLTQPPMTVVNVYLSESSRAVIRYYRMGIHAKARELCSIREMQCFNEAGVTLGDLARTMQKMRDAALLLLKNEEGGEEALVFAVESLPKRKLPRFETLAFLSTSGSGHYV